MTLDEFVKKYTGKRLEVAGSANAIYQCTDLVNGYIRDVLGLPIIEWTNAIDFPKKAGDKYEWIANTPTGVPQKGDLIVFNIGKYGHVSIFIDGDVNLFYSFDQNYPIRSSCHMQTHNYKNIVGWLRPKTQSNLTACLKAFTEVRTQLDKQGEEIIKLKSKNAKLVESERRWQTKLETVNDEIGKIQEQYSLLDENFKKISAEWKHYKTYYDRNSKLTGIELIIEGFKKIFEKKK